MIGTHIKDRYKIIKEISCSSTVRLFLAFDNRLNKIWSIKSYNTTQLSSIDCNSLKQSICMYMTLNHPCIPRIVDVIEDENYLHIVREYVEGQTLDAIVKKSGPISAGAVIDIAKKLCDVLQYLHTRMPPYIHRDIKPENVVLKLDGQITLICYNIMRLYDPQKTCDTEVCGTPGYAAPEQFGRSGTVDARTDIYELGATMYHLVTGRSPNEPPYEIRPICEMNPALSKHLEKIICKCVERDPANRYQSAAALYAVLNGEKDPDAPKGLFGKLFRKNK